MRAILLKLHIFAHLIESYPTVSGLSSCIEKKISIPLAAHTTVTCTLVAKCHFLHFRMLLYFSLTSYPAEIAYRMASLAWIALLELRLAEQQVSLRIKLLIPLGAHA